jgi:uncharacterized protein (TIGR03067 family)
MQTSLMLGLALAVAAPAPKEAPKKDPPSILGEWVPTTIVVGGKKEDQPAGSLMTFAKDGKSTMKEDKDAKLVEMSYTLDPKQDPSHITLTEAGMGNITLLGIYKLEGETLTICLASGKDRPTAFASRAGSANILITLKRPKKD